MTAPMRNPFDPKERREVLDNFARRLLHAAPDVRERAVESLANWVGNRMDDAHREGEKRGYRRGVAAVDVFRHSLRALLDDTD